MQEKIGGVHNPGSDAQEFSGVISFFKKLAIALIYAGGAYLLGSAKLVFDTSPLGVAFLCSAGSNVFSILGGLIVSVLLSDKNRAVWICTYIAAALIRIFSSLILEEGEKEEGIRKQEKIENANHFWKHLFNERTCLRIASSAVCMLLVSLYRVVLGGFAYYDLFAAFLSVAVAPIATTIYTVCLNRKEEGAELISKVSAGVLMVSLVFSCKGLAFYPNEIASILTLFFTFFACQKYGFAWGVGISSLCGLSIQVALFPAFPLAALLFDSMRRKGSEGSGIFLGSLVSFVWTVFVGGIPAFANGLFSCLVAGTLYTLYRRFTKEKEISEPVVSVGKAPAEKLHELEVEQKHFERRLFAISDAYSSLSEMFYRLSDRMHTPGMREIKQLCNYTAEAVCSQCENGEDCCSRTNFLNELPNLLRKGKNTTGKLIETTIGDACPNRVQLASSIHEKYAELSREALKNDRTEVLAMDFEGIAAQIRDMIEENQKSQQANVKIEKKICSYLRDIKLPFESVSVCGLRKKEINVSGCKGLENKEASKEFLAAVQEICSMSFREDNAETDGVYRLISETKITVIGAKKNIPKNGEISGDTLNCFSDGSGRFFALISDGMGNGKEAALASNLCSVVLEKMLTAGGNAKTAVRMLNQLLLSRRQGSKDEYSSTVDLMELNLYTGRAGFLKGGAAPCFIVRGDTVHRLQNETAPVGILRQTEIGSTDFLLRVGDTVIMVSDGILQDDPNAEWLTEELSECRLRNPDEIVKRIIRHSVAGKERDDCSVIALRIMPPKREDSFSEDF